MRPIPQVDRHRLVQRFCALVAVDNESLCEREMADAVIGQLRGLGIAVTEDTAAARLGGNAGNLLARIEGRGALRHAPPIAFCAHLDSVAPARGKQAVLREDGSITSAGDTVLGADDLAAVAALLEMTETLCTTEAEHRPLELLFTVCEERYTDGSRAMREQELPLCSSVVFVPDLTGRVGEAACAAPTILSVSVTVTGRASHAGFAPEQGIHAIAAAARALSCLTLGHVDEQTTVGIGCIRGGTAANAVPERCELQGEIRGYDHRRVWQEYEKLRALFCREAEKMGATAEVTCREMTHAYRVEDNDAALCLFGDACGRVGLTPVTRPTFGGSDANTLRQRGYAALVMASAMERVHSTDERTSVDELERLCSLVLALATSAPSPAELARPRA